MRAHLCCLGYGCAGGCYLVPHSSLRREVSPWLCAGFRSGAESLLLTPHSPWVFGCITCDYLAYCGLTWELSFSSSAYLSLTPLSVLDLLISLYGRPPAVTMPGGYHICCHIPLPPSQCSRLRQGVCPLNSKPLLFTRPSLGLEPLLALTF